MCPVCKKVHDEEHPYMFIIGGKVYWDCRRSSEYADGKKLFVGYLAMTVGEMLSGDVLTSIIPNDDDDDDDNGEFMFGDYNIGQPTLPPLVRSNNIKQTKTETPVIINGNLGDNGNVYIPPPEARRQNISNDLTMLQKSRAHQKYLRREPEDLIGVRRLNSVSSGMPWTPGYQK